MSDLWDWEHTGYANDKALVVFKCRGWKYTQKMRYKSMENRVTLRDIPGEARDALAKQVHLDASEFDYWAHDLKTYAGTDGIYVEISVPNVWICADLLRGGSWYSDQPVFGVSGSLMQIPIQLFTWTQKVVKCESFEELQINLGKYQGKLWGMALFAHGDEFGRMTPTRESYTDIYNQSRIMLALAPNGYKLAKIYAMQCYSGYKGTLTIDKDKLLNLLDTISHKGYYWDYIIPKYPKLKFRDEREAKSFLEEVIRGLFKNQKKLDILGIRFSTYSFEVKIKVDWDANWHSYGIDVKTYQGMNVALVDVGKLEDWLTAIFKR